MYPARLDDKGRLKLPAKIQEFLAKFTERTFFCTSLDGRIAQIYPIPVWDKYQEFLDSYTEDPKAVQAVMFRAQDLGAEADMDAQGRITLNSELRQALNLQQGQELRLMVDRGRVQVMTPAVYDAMKAAADENVDAVHMLEKAGLGKGIRY
jgi:MraZ protein